MIDHSPVFSSQHVHMHLYSEENHMTFPRAALVAAAIPLLLTSLPLTAGEVMFNVPATERANESAALLQRTAWALQDSHFAASHGVPADERIGNLWLFPTDDAHTVFARYELTSSSGAVAAPVQHLVVLTVRQDRIVDFHELTSAADGSAPTRPASLHWSAAIGTGYAARTAQSDIALQRGDTDTGSGSHVVAPSLHWTASIGTGTATTSAVNSRGTTQPSSPSLQLEAPTTHWTARIGRGDASTSSSNAAVK
jgi:hypothetical protein